jgi:hypothetical protein
MPPVHTPDAQSPFAPHTFPAGQEGAHRALQTPPEHAVPAPHPLPHVPQLVLSVAVSTQSPLQSVPTAPEQEASQDPAEQCVPFAQTVPHAPQLSGSSWVRAQYEPAPVPHVAYGVAHVAAQVACEHT